MEKIDHNYKDKPPWEIKEREDNDTVLKDIAELKSSEDRKYKISKKDLQQILNCLAALNLYESIYVNIHGDPIVLNLANKLLDILEGNGK